MSAEVFKKLRFKEGQAAAVLNAPEGWETGIPADRELSGNYEFVLIFAKHRAEAEEGINAAIPHLAHDAVFWLAYPKQSSKIKTDINRDSLWRLVEDTTAYTLVSNVALDETWSALRLRHKSLTTSKSKR